MSQNSSGGAALYIAWKFEPDDEIGARRVMLQLQRGRDQNLYRLRSWVIAGGEARAPLAPVSMGLATRPEQWPFSSGASD